MFFPTKTCSHRDAFEKTKQKIRFIVISTNFLESICRISWAILLKCASSGETIKYWQAMVPVIFSSCVIVIVSVCTQNGVI
jgi:hypothetical protein